MVRNLESANELEERINRVLKEKFLCEDQLAERWGIKKKTLQKFRHDGRGPYFHHIGGSIRYALSDILSFEEANRKRSNSRTTCDKPNA